MKRNLGSIILLVALLFGSSEAFAQAGPPQPLPSSIICATCQVSLSVTNTSGRVALPSTSPPFNTLTIYNSGAKDAYFIQGGVSSVATTANIRVPAGAAISVYTSATYVAAITAGSDTTTLLIYQSNGPISLIVPGSGSGGAPLPVGASTSALQTSIGATAHTDSGTINTTLGSPMQQTGGTVGLAAGSTIGGYEFNTSVIPTVQNAAYAAGQSLGGLQTISIGSTNGLTGILDQIRIASKGGSTVAVVIYVWDKNPASTTCTDKSNFVASQADDQHMILVPQLLSPALSVSAQDTSTRAQASNLTANFVNSSSNTDLYVCILANASVTPATTTDYRLNIQGIKDQP